MTLIFLSALLLLALSQALGFYRTGGSRSSQRCRQSLSMIGGFGFLNKPKPPPGSKRISINVDGKRVLELDEPTNLRRVLQANKIDVYPLRGKLSNCGGAGICGTCAVKVLEGMSNLNPPSKNEQKTLEGKPADFRLSCCARVTGPISIKTKP